MKCLFAMLCLCLLAYQCESAPPHYHLVIYPQRHYMHPHGQDPRPLFSSIGDWITNSEWFPIEINIPDTINSITNGISGITGSISNGISGIAGLAQRIPFIHRLTSPERPRPLHYVILVPNQPNNGHIQNENHFNPFAHDADIFPRFP